MIVYEMRMSDWSSVVCSSVLGAEKFPDLADLAGIVTGDHHLAGLELSDRLFLALRFVHRPTAPVTAASCAAKIWLQPIRAKRSRRSKFSSSKHSPSAVARSEEHTSELHSLIRITYAVFC